MISFITSCFSSSRAKEARLNHHEARPDQFPTAQRPADNVNPNKCIFCNVTPDKFNIVLQNEKFICFKDSSPAANEHLLVIPRRHIANVQTLTQKDVQLVKDMQAFGEKALELVALSSTQEKRYGFHIPPFRSVDHLHLHCLQLLFRSFLRKLKYRIAQPSSQDYHKGWSWFAEWQQTCAILQDGGKVKVAKC